MPFNGVNDASGTGVKYTHPPTKPQSGWYAASVEKICACRRESHYFPRIKPVTMAECSIHIYHITLDDANCVGRELGLAELPAFQQPDGGANDQQAH